MQPTFTTRRDFLRSTVLGGAVAWSVPAFLAQTWQALGDAARDSAVQTVTGRDGPILVVVQMAGGNDALNTVVPLTDDEYRRARPRLALPAKDLLKLNDTLALHGALKGVHALFDAGHAAIVLGVGYPNPNRSHFRSMEIWHTATDADRIGREGWIGRYFDSACAGADPAVGVNVGRQLPQAFTGRLGKGIAVAGPARGRAGGMPQTGPMVPGGADGMHPDAGEETGGTISALPGPSRASGNVLDFLDRTALDARVANAAVREITSRVRNQAGYPPSQLAQSLKLVAQLIAGGLPARIYYVSQGGYDTHRDQPGQHARLLTELGDGLKAFVDDLKAQGHFERVLTMTFSEFGRRVAENASGGTDHGAAGAMFVLGRKPASPFLGRYPSLAPGDLVNGDLRFSVDFRRVYAAVLDGWLKTPSEPILGRKFDPLALV